MKAVKRFCYVIMGLVMLLMVLSMSVSCEGESQTMFEETHAMMDTYVRIVVYSPDEEIAEEVINAAFERIEEVIAAASRFDETAEVYRLNRDSYIEAPSPDLIELVELSIEYYELTGGAFDVTCLPLLDLWSYAPAADVQFWELDAATQQAAIDEAMELVGSDKIVVTEDRISFAEEGMRITLDGIAKGYAVDEALAVIKSMGIRYALINGGGDIGTLGSKPARELWQIALANPDYTEESLATFRFHDEAVATSGNYERYFDPEAEAGHILNPQTGYSAADCISVTIVADNCTYADTLATGVFVMGPEDGLALVETLDGVECLIIDTDRQLHQSSGLSKYLK